MRRIAGVLVFLWVMLSAVLVHAEMQPDELVRTTTEEILTLLREKHDYYDEDRNRLYVMVDARILPHFDFRKMSQWVLGLNWRRANEDQRQRFTQEFKTLLVRTYAVALLKYTNEKMIYLPYTGKPDDERVVVKVEIKQTSGAPNISMRYTFYNRRPGWKVFDLTIEGVSLVTNYRKIYAAKIRREGVDGLIAGLAAVNRKGKVKQAKSGT